MASGFLPRETGESVPQALAGGTHLQWGPGSPPGTVCRSFLETKPL